MSTPGKEDCEELIAVLMPFAEMMLQKHGEFFPFGGRMDHDGAITHEGASDGSEQPPSKILIDLLNDVHRTNRASLRACAVVYDVRTIPPGRDEKQDAIAVALDHVSGYSAVVIFPYTLDLEKQLKVEAAFAVKGDGAIFEPDILVS